jgi:hypothetical protein
MTLVSHQVHRGENIVNQLRHEEHQKGWGAVIHASIRTRSKVSTQVHEQEEPASGQVSFLAFSTEPKEHSPFGMPLFFKECK